MSSKIKVDTIENVAGSGNVSLGSGHNLVVPGTLNITGASTLTGGIANAGTITAGTIGTSVVFPAGCILQTVQTVKTDVFETSSTSDVDITGLTITITPRFATSKVLIMFNIHINGNDSGTGLRLFRGSTNLTMGDAAGSRARMMAIGMYSTGSDSNAYSNLPTSMTFLDSPATTSATTYKIQGQTLSGGFRVNKTRYDTDNGNASRGISTITAMEIAQ